MPPYGGVEALGEEIWRYGYGPEARYLSSGFPFLPLPCSTQTPACRSVRTVTCYLGDHGVPPPRGSGANCGRWIVVGTTPHTNSASAPSRGIGTSLSRTWRRWNRASRVGSLQVTGNCPDTRYPTRTSELDQSTDHVPNRQANGRMPSPERHVSRCYEHLQRVGVCLAAVLPQYNC